MPLFGSRRAYEEGLATGFAWGGDVAYGTIRMVLAEMHLPFDQGGHPLTCECRPCELIREVLETRKAS